MERIPMKKMAKWLPLALIGGAALYLTMQKDKHPKGARLATDAEVNATIGFTKAQEGEQTAAELGLLITALGGLWVYPDEMVPEGVGVIPGADGKPKYVVIAETALYAIMNPDMVV
jgi:hypothetical protein